MAIPSLYQRPIHVGPGLAPLTYAEALKNIRHKPGCKVQLVSLENADAAHSTRRCCACMSDYDIDKQIVLEFQARERTRSAFLQLLTLIEIYGFNQVDVIHDPELYQVVTKYDFLAQVSAQIKQSSPTKLIHKPKPMHVPQIDVKTYEDEPNIRCLISKEKWNDLVKAVKFRTPNHYISCFSTDTRCYNVCIDTPNLFASYKIVKDFPRRAVIRVSALLDCNLSSLLAVMSEVQMAKSWVPYFRFPLK